MLPGTRGAAGAYAAGVPRVEGKHEPLVGNPHPNSHARMPFFFGALFRRRRVGGFFADAIRLLSFLGNDDTHLLSGKAVLAVFFFLSGRFAFPALRAGFASMGLLVFLLVGFGLLTCLRSFSAAAEVWAVLTGIACGCGEGSLLA